MKTYADQTTQNKSWLKRFSHGSRFKVALDLLNPAPEDQILDYGTGDGYMLSMIRLTDDNCRIVGYEPVPYMFKELNDKLGSSKNESVELIHNLNGYTGNFNKICCLEVLEHLTKENQTKEITNMMNLLTEDGKLIISVPVEIGFSSLLKNIARIVLGQAHGNTNLRTIIYSVFGIHFDRGNRPYIFSHMGFYYQDLENLIVSLGLTIHSKKFSPISMLGRAINSQVFFVLRKS